MKYIMNQMHKDLVKKRENKKYERSKIKVRYDHNKDSMENLIDSDELDFNPKKEEFSPEKEDELSIILNSEDKIEEKEDKKDKEKYIEREKEKEMGKELNNVMNLIYDNSYLFKRKKKDIKIRDEVLEILNKIEKLDEQEKNKISEPPSGERNDITNKPDNSSISTSIKMSRNDSMKSNKKKKIKKKKQKVNSEKKRMSIFDQMKLDMPNDEIKEVNEGEKSDDEGILIKRKTLEEKLEEFFNKIKMMKKSSQNEDLDILMNELIDNNMEKEKKKTDRRLYNFFEAIINSSDYDKILRPKFNFLSPIKFSTNIYSEYSNSNSNSD